MSLLPVDSMKTIAESIGISQLPDDVALSLTQDIEYRLRDIIQEAKKFMRHSKRTRLSTEDVNSALRVRNVERLYGFASNASMHFKSIQSNSLGWIYYVEDEEVDFDDILNAPMPKVPLAMSFTAHWLAVEGVQPAIPQNPAPVETRIESLSRRLKAEGKFDLADRKFDVKPLVRHVLSKELQLYYEKIVQALQHTSADLRHAALESIREDNGLQQLLPYLIQFLTDQVCRNLKNLTLLTTMMLLTRCFLENPNLFIEPYLHQLMPPVLSCLVSRRLSERPDEDHWSLRLLAAGIMAQICRQFGSNYETLESRVTRTLLRAFMDPTKPLTTHFGAITGLSLLGTEVIKTLLIPNMKAYLELLATQGIATSHPVKKMEAEHCRLALETAAARYIVGKVMAESAIPPEFVWSKQAVEALVAETHDLSEWFGEEPLMQRCRDVASQAT